MRCGGWDLYDDHIVDLLLDLFAKEFQVIVQYLMTLCNNGTLWLTIDGPPGRFMTNCPECCHSCPGVCMAVHTNYKVLPVQCTY